HHRALHSFPTRRSSDLKPRQLARSHGPTRKHDMEIVMKYVLLGSLSPEWASKQSERIGTAKTKLDQLGIKIESIHYTQGYYDFVDRKSTRLNSSHSQIS